MENDTLYLEIWKKSRETIEHFDNILGNFRRTLFTINGVVLGIAGSIFLSRIEDKIFYLSLLGIASSIIDFIIWIAEKHYHLYLLVSARVAKKAEGFGGQVLKHKKSFFGLAIFQDLTPLFLLKEILRQAGINEGDWNKA